MCTHQILASLLMYFSFVSNQGNIIRKPPQSGERCVEISVISTYSTSDEGGFLLYLNKVIFCHLYTILKVNKTMIFAKSDTSKSQ